VATQQLPKAIRIAPVPAKPEVGGKNSHASVHTRSRWQGLSCKRAKPVARTLMQACRSEVPRTVSLDAISAI
jgi:hypothetical protein